MSTNIRRSSRRAAAKSATNATVDDDLIKNISEKSDTTAQKAGGQFQSPDKVRGQNDVANTNNRNDNESVRGRTLRRQTSTTSPQLSDDAKAPATVGDSNATPATSTSRKREGTVSPDSSNSNNTTGQDNDQAGDDHKSKKSRKSVTFEGSTEMIAAAANSESDNSKRLRTAAQVAREQRSHRRQAAQGIDEEKRARVVSLPCKQDGRINHKKKVARSTTGNSNNSEEDANVVRVPMLTGTLLLYRGAHPRAVFIRRV